MAASEEQMLSLEEVAERLQVSDQTVRRWIKSGRLSAYKPGLEWRIRPKDLEAFLETRSYPKSSAPSPSAEDSPELRRSPIEAVAAAADVWLRIASHPQIDPKESSVLATAADVLDDQL